MKDAFKTVRALIVLGALIGALTRWPWHSITMYVLHSVPLILLGIVVVPAGTAFFLLSVVSISNRPR